MRHPGCRTQRRTDEREAHEHLVQRTCDIQQALQTPKPATVATTQYLTVLVVGASGLGKTTFIRNLQDITSPELDLDSNPEIPRQTNPTLDTFCKNPIASCTSIKIGDGSCSYCYRFQDTPGLASRQVVEAICKHAAAQDQDYLRHEQDLKRGWLMADREDARIDACLMFLNPHVIEAKEVALMQGMCKLGVPVIPLIAKADTYSPDEKARYRIAVMRALHQARTQPGKPIAWQVSPDSTEAIGKEMPFAVITGTGADSAVHRNWLIRENAYGSCEVLASEKSDILALKALLFNLEFHRLKQHTEARRDLSAQRRRRAMGRFSRLALFVCFMAYWVYLNSSHLNTQLQSSSDRERKCGAVLKDTQRLYRMACKTYGDGRGYCRSDLYGRPGK